MLTGNPQRQRRLITRLKNIRKFFKKHEKRAYYYEDAQYACKFIIEEEIMELKHMKVGRKK